MNWMNIRERVEVETKIMISSPCSAIPWIVSVYQNTDRKKKRSSR